MASPPTKFITIDGFDETQGIALASAIERNSVHPIAKAIAALDNSLTAEGVVESAGTGVVGQVEGLKVEVSRRPAETFENAAQVQVAIDQAGQQPAHREWGLRPRTRTARPVSARVFRHEDNERRLQCGGGARGRRPDSRYAGWCPAWSAATR